MAAESTVSESKEDFGKRISSSVEGGCIALGLAVGVSTGLLGKMASFSFPKTSKEIAAECNMKERYVREWLGLMVCSDVIELDATSQTFFLPQHRRPYFTAGCREEESSLFVDCFGHMVTGAIDDVEQCFRLDGPKGVPSSAYKCFPKMSRPRFEDHLIKELETFPDVKDRLKSGARVLDVACGKGFSTCIMAKQYPNSRVIGLDIANGALSEAAEAAASQNLSNAEFVLASAEDMPSDWTDTVDFLFLYNGVHDSFRPDKMLREALRVMKPNAKAIIHEPVALSNLAEDARTPGAVARYGFSLFYCLPTALHPPDETPEAEGLGLGTSWGKERCLQMLTDIGFNVQSIDKEIGGKTWLFYCTK